MMEVPPTASNVQAFLKRGPEDLGWRDQGTGADEDCGL